MPFWLLGAIQGSVYLCRSWSIFGVTLGRQGKKAWLLTSGSYPEVAPPKLLMAGQVVTWALGDMEQPVR